METERIQEYVASGGKLRVDRQRGIIEGVKVLGLVSKNGRTYSAAGVERARPLYEGAKVNVNHSTRPDEARGYESRIGQLRNVRSDGAGLKADLHFNPKHALAEQLAWDAENAPENVGLSHNVEAKVSRKGGRVLVEEIVKVHSVDLVADPASTRGLHESTGDAAGDAAALVASIGAELGIPSAALAAIGTGAGSFVGEHCPDAAAVREHLAGVKKHLVEMGLLVDRRQAARGFLDRASGDADFLATVGANRPGGRDRFNETVLSIPTEANRHAIDEALGLPNRNSKAKSFLDAIS